MALALRLRDATRTLHSQAERAGLMPDLLRGQLPLAVFCALQRNLHALYAALEPALAGHARHPALAPLPLAELGRCAALAEDLQALHGPHWARALALTAPTQAYVQRLQALADDQPTALVAHAYVRYLGDLSGGQLLSQRVRQAYALAGEAGTRFFDFGPPAQVARLAQQLRAGLDALPLDEAQQAAVVAEAQWAFVQHGLVFEALAASPA